MRVLNKVCVMNDQRGYGLGLSRWAIIDLPSWYSTWCEGPASSRREVRVFLKFFGCGTFFGITEKEAISQRVVQRIK